MKKLRVLKGFGHWVMVVKENVSVYEKAVLEAPGCATSESVHRLLRDRALSEAIERMWIVGLDGQNHVTMLHEVARGGLHGCAISARDILRVVLMAGCSGFILVHNHPSGDPTPSHEDVVMTKRVVEAANVVGTPLVDHIVIARLHSYRSMLDMGAIG